MISTSRFVLRGALAGAIAVLASTNFGASAMAQQVAVNTEDGANAEDQTAREPSADEEPPTDAETRQTAELLKEINRTRTVIDCWRALGHLQNADGINYVRLGFGPPSAKSIAAGSNGD